MKKRKDGFYNRYIKRVLDVILASLALIVFMPTLILLTILGALFMRGNPFFTQMRPGLHEKSFLLIKFRSMDFRKDEKGQLLPDLQRLNGYGRFLRTTSLDELPELFNILSGKMSLVGPRPLLEKYIQRYSSFQHRRHEVRPGLTGYAQIHGRNCASWDQRFEMDVYYVDHVSFFEDARIVFRTVGLILGRTGIDSGESNTVSMREFEGSLKNEDTVFSDS